MTEKNSFNQDCINHIATFLFARCRDKRPLCPMLRQFKTMPEPTPEMIRAGVIAGAANEKQAKKIFNAMTRCCLREGYKYVKKSNFFQSLE